MRLVPCHCHACKSYWLQAHADIDQDGNTACGCGGAARALPGESYSPADESLFDAIINSLRTAQVTAMQAVLLTIELERCEDVTPAGKLARLSQLVPAFSIIELIATTDPARSRKAVGMFALLLDAIAMTHRSSDFSSLALPAAANSQDRS
jgi:hypothetical protein